WTDGERSAWPRRPNACGAPVSGPTRWRDAWAWTWPGSRRWSRRPKRTRRPPPRRV
ncbi:MAG: hypothetical protein AVDCRST_MAG22-1854, partial [uncultured Rubrobacteraceae bacterium]